MADGSKQAINDFDSPGYGGPYPLQGQGIHRCHFRLMALGTASLPAAPSGRRAEVIRLAQPEILVDAEFVGV